MLAFASISASFESCSYLLDVIFAFPKYGICVNLLIQILFEQDSTLQSFE